MADAPKDSSPAAPAKPASGAVPADGTLKKGPPGIDHHVADADKLVRTGHRTESVRDTPPAGAWNDTSGD
jgi:hypothetical protein